MRKIYNSEHNFLNYMNTGRFANHFTRMLLLLERLQNVIVEVFIVFCCAGVDFPVVVFRFSSALVGKLIIRTNKHPVFHNICKEKAYIKSGVNRSCSSSKLTTATSTVQKI
jgi:hypothetical protein